MELLPHVELVTGADPTGTVIWMHGLGADGWDFVPIVRELPLPEDMALRFIFPHAQTHGSGDHECHTKTHDLMLQQVHCFPQFQRLFFQGHVGAF